VLEVNLDARALVVVLCAAAFILGCHSARRSRTGSTCDGLPPDTRPDHVSRASGPSDDAARGAMRGGLVVRLTNVETGRPVDRALVHLWAGDRMLAPAEPPAADTDGIHAFASIPAGYYVVRASRIGYRSQVLAEEVRPGFTDTVKIAWQMRALCIVE
jgi:hypothetical protein